jgi:PQQ-dependent catabolism-associated beta-propeller protein
MKITKNSLGIAALCLFASAASADTVFVTLEKDNALAIVDGKAGKLIKTIELGQRPRGIMLSADGSKLYVAASDDDTIQIIDSTSYMVVGELPSGEDPETFDLSPDGTRLYVSNEDDDLVTVIDTVSQKVVKEIDVGVEPEGIATSPDGKWVVNSSETTNMIHWIDTKTLEIAENTLVDQRPRAVKFTADSKQLWVTSEVGGVLSILDAQTQQTIKKLNFKIRGVTAEQIQPVGIAIDQAGRWGYVALGPANRVAVIDAKKLEIVDYLLVGQRVWNLAFSPDQSRLYTTNGVSNDISIIKTENHKVLKSVAVGRYPWGVVVK